MALWDKNKKSKYIYIYIYKWIHHANEATKQVPKYLDQPVIVNMDGYIYWKEPAKWQDHKGAHNKIVISIMCKVGPYRFVDLEYQGKDIVFRFIIEYSSLMDFGP
jgi:hypothetical protein